MVLFQLLKFSHPSCFIELFFSIIFNLLKFPPIKPYSKGPRFINMSNILAPVDTQKSVIFPVYSFLKYPVSLFLKYSVVIYINFVFNDERLQNRNRDLFDLHLLNFVFIICQFEKCSAASWQSTIAIHYNDPCVVLFYPICHTFKTTHLRLKHCFTINYLSSVNCKCDLILSGDLPEIVPRQCQVEILVERHRIYERNADIRFLLSEMMLTASLNDQK